MHPKKLQKFPKLFRVILFEYSRNLSPTSASKLASLGKLKITKSGSPKASNPSRFLRIDFLLEKVTANGFFRTPKALCFGLRVFLGYWKGWFRTSKSHGKKLRKTKQTKQNLLAILLVTFFGDGLSDHWGITWALWITWPWIFTTLKTKITNAKQQKNWNITQPALPTFSSSFIHPLHPQTANPPPKKNMAVL